MNKTPTPAPTPIIRLLLDEIKSRISVPIPPAAGVVVGFKKAIAVDEVVLENDDCVPVGVEVPLGHVKLLLFG